jgi:hypothetical protein
MIGEKPDKVPLYSQNKKTGRVSPVLKNQTNFDQMK